MAVKGKLKVAKSPNGRNRKAQLAGKKAVTQKATAKKVVAKKVVRGFVPTKLSCAARCLQISQSRRKPG